MRGSVMPASQGHLITADALGPFHLVESVHERGLSLLRHSHEWATITIVLDGEFAEILPDGPRWCQPGTVLIKPPHVPHSNWYGGRNARCLIAEIRNAPDAASGEEHPVSPQRVMFSAHGHLSRMGGRIASAYRERDDAARMTIESLLHEMIPAGGDHRLAGSTTLQRALDFVHTEFMRPLRLREVAAASGVQPSPLARAFRRHFGRTPGDLLRELRVHWAAHLLVESEHEISRVALESGFTDQSHLTRVFVRRMGCPPALYRRLRRPARSG